jgi:hypothetical protein
MKAKRRRNQNDLLSPLKGNTFIVEDKVLHHCDY